MIIFSLYFYNKRYKRYRYEIKTINLETKYILCQSISTEPYRNQFISKMSTYTKVQKFFCFKLKHYMKSYRN